MGHVGGGGVVGGGVVGGGVVGGGGVGGGGDEGEGGDGGNGGDGGCAQITKPAPVIEWSLLHAIVSPAAITTPSGPVLPQYLVPPTVRES